MGQRDSNTPKENRNEWRTPPHIFQQASEQWGPFDLDAAASNENALCEAFYSKECSGLENPWFGRVWCNPPYGRGELDQWCRKAFEESQKGVVSCLLLPGAVSEGWFHRWVWGKSLFIPINGRVQFLRPDGVQVKGTPFGSFFAVYGIKETER